MIKYICIEDYGILKMDTIYYINSVVIADDPFTDFIEIFDINMKYIGSLWLNLKVYFIPLSEYREQQINQIIND